MRRCPCLLAVALLAACAEAPAPADPVPVEPVPIDPPAATAQPTALGPDDGERLRFFDGREVVLKVTAEGVGAERLFLGTEALPSGTAIPVHTHDGYEEILFVHEGTARLTLGDSVVEAGPGTTLYVPPGAWHGVAAGGPDSTTVLFIFPETAFADFFRAAMQAEGGPPPDLTEADWAELMARHRMRSRAP